MITLELYERFKHQDAQRTGGICGCDEFEGNSKKTSRKRRLLLESRTVRYHLKKLEKAGLIGKTVNGKSRITLKGIEELRRG